jgi:hypothetical protein
MDPEVLFLVVQMSTVVMLVVIIAALRLAISLWRDLKGKPGSDLSRVNLIILAALAAAQAVIVVNTFTGVLGISSYPERQTIYALTQWGVIVVVIWAYRQLRKLRRPK